MLVVPVLFMCRDFLFTSISTVHPVAIAIVIRLPPLRSRGELDCHLLPLPYLLRSVRRADATRFYFHVKSRNLGVSRSKGWHL